MNCRSLLLALIGCAASALSPSAAAEWTDSIRYSAEVGVTLSDGGHTPLWLSANRFGFSSLERNNLWLRVGAFKDMDRTRRFSWGAGVDMGVAHRFQSVFMPQQLYAEVKYRCLDAMAGAKEITDGFLNQDLSSGALTQGWNAPRLSRRVGMQGNVRHQRPYSLRYVLRQLVAQSLGKQRLQIYT